MIRSAISDTMPLKYHAPTPNKSKNDKSDNSLSAFIRSGGYRIPDFCLDLPLQIDNVVLKNGSEFARNKVVTAMRSLKSLDGDSNLKDRDFVFEHLSALAKSEIQGLPYKIPHDVLSKLEEKAIVKKQTPTQETILDQAMASVIASSVKKEDARIELNTPILLYRLNLEKRLASIRQDWTHQIVNTVTQKGTHIPLTGEDFNSFPNTLDEEVAVRLAGKSVVKEHLPWLYSFYNTDIRSIVSKVFNRPLFPTSEAVASKDAGLVINYTPPGKAYENHVDSNPVTAVLYTKDLHVGQGGLVVHPEGKKFVIAPKKGDVFIFDGRQLPHEVEPTTQGRASVPMDFYVDETKQWRHPSTDKLVINGKDAN